MAEYRTENGDATKAFDPDRLIWYGWCTYWTDDWEKIRNTKDVSGIPCCPVCGAYGFQSLASKWFEGAKRFEAEGNPRYVEFVHAFKEQCRGRKGSFMEEYRNWFKEQKNGC